MKHLPLLFCFAFLLAGCSQKYEGVTAEEWANKTIACQYSLEKAVENNKSLQKELAEARKPIDCKTFGNLPKQEVLQLAIKNGATLSDVEKLDKLYRMVCESK